MKTQHHVVLGALVLAVTCSAWAEGGGNGNGGSGGGNAHGAATAGPTTGGDNTSAPTSTRKGIHLKHKKKAPAPDATQAQ
ncbi:hypothetical protein [Paraburkholderia sp. DHOC27]|uniref:hypothetical protein n=1 Tax=Paraburkholderia sp. DHOC27 TaxID=2303330 RepID=UPI000E3ED7F2|nr:hypothetical protein [Paraburkholderia sp. DHOC27]RFU48939.1 hypothetical protein D0B32_03660 [Paraburkholderia sp. DHOC27]